MIIYLVAIVALMYFIMIRPQRKKQKKEEEMFRLFWKIRNLNFKEKEE